MIKACLFDLDGTLLDTLTSINERLNETLARHGFHPISREQARVFVGDGARELVLRAIASQRVGVDMSVISAVHRDYVDYYNADFARGTEPYSGINGLLSELKKKGMRLAVISNKPDPTVKQLCELFFDGIFDLVYGAREGVKLKPAPDAPLEICHILGVSPDETAYFGDTGVDMQTAKNYGAGIGIGVLWGFRDSEELSTFGADALISSPLQALKYLN